MILLSKWTGLAKRIQGEVNQDACHRWIACATNWWMSYLFDCHDCSTIQNHIVLLVHTYTYTCVYTFTFCINYYSYSYICTYHLFHYYSTFPLLLHRDEITLRYMKGLPALQILSCQFYFLKTNLGGVENCQVTRKIWEYRS